MANISSRLFLTEREKEGLQRFMQALNSYGVSPLLSQMDHYRASVIDMTGDGDMLYIALYTELIYPYRAEMEPVNFQSAPTLADAAFAPDLRYRVDPVRFTATLSRLLLLQDNKAADLAYPASTEIVRAFKNAEDARKLRRLLEQWVKTGVHHVLRRVATEDVEVRWSSEYDLNKVRDLMYDSAPPEAIPPITTQAQALAPYAPLISEDLVFVHEAPGFMAVARLRLTERGHRAYKLLQEMQG